MDHGTHESIYVSDPDRNGIELCWDRPDTDWPLDADGHLAFDITPIDIDLLLAEHRER